jgi:hypothetical protein
VFVTDLLTSSSFGNIWYWLFMAITWSTLCHWILGVPYDMVLDAERKGGTFESNCEAMIQAHVLRVTTIFQSGGVAIIAGVAFVLALLATIGFGFLFEGAIAAFMMLTPIVLVMGASVHLAFQIQREGLSGPAVRSRMGWRRFWNQVIGLISIVCSASTAVMLDIIRTTPI